MSQREIELLKDRLPPGPMEGTKRKRSKAKRWPEEFSRAATPPLATSKRMKKAHDPDRNSSFYRKVAPGVYAKCRWPNEEFHNDECEVCGDAGKLLMCSACNLVFHSDCLKACGAFSQGESDDNWLFCPLCIMDGAGGPYSNKDLKRAKLVSDRMTRRQSEASVSAVFNTPVAAINPGDGNNAITCITAPSGSSGTKGPGFKPLAVKGDSGMEHEADDIGQLFDDDDFGHAKWATGVKACIIACLLGNLLTMWNNQKMTKNDTLQGTVALGLIHGLVGYTFCRPIDHCMQKIWIQTAITHLLLYPLLLASRAIDLLERHPSLLVPHLADCLYQGIGNSLLVALVSMTPVCHYLTNIASRLLLIYVVDVVLVSACRAYG